MKNTKKVILFLVALITICMIRLAYATNWAEVTVFNGAASQDTAYFTCAHAEWRIDWSYTPEPGSEQYALFDFSAYDNESNLAGYVDQSGATQTSGITYVHNDPGTFYLSIDVANLQGYSITIEQDLDSAIPELSIPMMLLGLALVGTLFVCIKRGKLERQKGPGRALFNLT